MTRLFNEWKQRVLKNYPNNNFLGNYCLNIGYFYCMVENIVTQKFGHLNIKRIAYSVMGGMFGLLLLRDVFLTYERYEVYFIMIISFIILMLLLASVVMFIRALPKWTNLEVNENGFVVTMIKTKYSHEWKECSRFFETKKPKMRFFSQKYYVGCDIHHPTKTHQFNKTVTGAHVAFIDDYGVKTSDLVDIMNEYRERSIK